MKHALYGLISTVLVCPVWGQIAQSHPEYCGIPGGANPPLPDISATIDPTDGHAELYFGQGSAARRVALDADWVSEIAEVCPVYGGRLAVFAVLPDGVATYILDKAQPSVVDWFYGFNPTVSPDQRWIVCGKFHHFYTAESTAEYLLYDLTKSPLQNRPEGDSKDTGTYRVDVGSAIFPAGQKNVADDNVGVPEEQQHSGGGPFYWASDSRAVVFVDHVVGKPRKIILVSLTDQGASTAFEHQVTVTDLCGREIPGADPEGWTWVMTRIDAGPDRGGSRSIVLYPNLLDAPCPARAVPLYSGDFQPSKAEVHVVQEPTGGMIRDGYPPIPPKKKK